MGLLNWDLDLAIREQYVNRALMDNYADIGDAEYGQEIDDSWHTRDFQGALQQIERGCKGILANVHIMDRHAHTCADDGVRRRQGECS